MAITTRKKQSAKQKTTAKKKTTGKKTTARKSPAKVIKTSSRKKVSTKKSSPKKTATKKVAPRKFAPKKLAQKKVFKNIGPKKGEILFSLSIKAEPAIVYKTLLDSELYEGSTGEHAHVSHCEDGKVKIQNGHIQGKNLILIPEKRIVQSWRHEDWPPGVFSTATFTFKKTREGTQLEFKQTGVPEYAEETVKREWTELYWNPLRRQLESGQTDQKVQSSPTTTS